MAQQMMKPDNIDGLAGSSPNRMSGTGDLVKKVMKIGVPVVVAVVAAYSMLGSPAYAAPKVESQNQVKAHNGWENPNGEAVRVGWGEYPVPPGQVENYIPPAPPDEW